MSNIKDKSYDDVNIMVCELLNEFNSIDHYTWRWIQLNELFMSIDNMYEKLYSKVMDMMQKTA